MKVVVISDTHGMHDHLNVPHGDVLIHAGDISGRGSLTQMEDFCVWLDWQPHDHKIVIAGNHDLCFEDKSSNCQRAKDMVNNVATYLQDSSIVINGVKFYGSPWQPEFFNWAFNLPRGQALEEKWAQIEDDTEVLITHGPPLHILDWCPGGNVGDCALAARVKELPQLKAHVFGHIHESYGSEKHGEVLYVNASTCNGNYKPVNKPIEFEL